MKAIELLEKIEVFPRLNKLFPEFVETAREIEIIPWQEDFQVADRNPQVLDTLDFYRELFRNKLITQEEFERHTERAFAETKGMVSRTEGIAFIETKEISFRSPRPNPAYIIHEIGHIHYREPDPIWSSVYGGGEGLMQLALWKGYTTNDNAIRKFHKILHDSAINPDLTATQLANEITQKVKINCYPHLYALMLYSGIIPDNLLEQLQDKNLMELLDNFQDPRWESIKVSHTGIRSFIVNIIEGIKWNDSFCIAYTEALNLIWTCPVCNRLQCNCK